MSRLSAGLRKRIWNLEDALFERFAGLDFGPSIQSADLQTDYVQSRTHAQDYQGVRYRKMRILLSKAKKLGIVFDTFVDVGCGSGKACCIAARDKTFAEIIGFDFSADLVARASRNGQRLGDRRLHFVCADAVEYSLPDRCCLIFLFNPFDDKILSRFLGRNKAVLHRHDSVIAYANAVYPDILERANFEIAYQDSELRLSLYRSRSAAAGQVHRADREF